MYLLIC